MRKLILLTAVIVGMLAFAPQPALAIPAGCPGGPDGPPAPDTQCPGGEKINCPDGYTAVSVRVSGSQCVKGIFAYLDQIVRVIEGLIGVGVVIAIVVAGIQYITSAGSPDAVKSAKSRMGNAIMGLVVYLLLLAIVEWLGIN